MSDPAHHVVDAMYLLPIRQGWTVNHQHRHAQLPRRRQLGHGPGATGIFRHDQIHAMTPQQGQIVVHRERSAINLDHTGREWQSVLWLIHQAQHVLVLGIRREFVQMHATYSQKHTTSGSVQRLHRRRNIGDMFPPVTRPGLPWRAGQSDQRHACLGTGHNRMMAHLRGKRMRGINHMRDLMIPQILHQPVDPAKPANPLRQGLRDGLFHTARQRHGPGNPRLDQRLAQRRRLGGAAQNKQVW